MPMTRIMREFRAADRGRGATEFGMRVITPRRISDANALVRVTNLVFRTPSPFP
jgi:hypothetical protein